MNAGLLDVLHDAGDNHILGVAERVHVHLDGVLQEVIDQHRPLLRILHRLAHIARHGLGVVGDDHGPPAEHIAGPHQHRVADALADGQSLFHAGGRAAGGLRNLQLVEQLAEALAVLGQVNRLRRSADDGHAGRAQPLRQIQRRLPAKLHNHADLRARLRFVVVDGQHVFQHQRLKVEPVAGVVIGGDGLRIAVDHDGLVAVVLEREGRVAAAVIELDALADAIRPRAENDDLWRLRSAAPRPLRRRSSRGRASWTQTRRRRCPPA